MSFATAAGRQQAQMAAPPGLQQPLQAPDMSGLFPLVLQLTDPSTAVRENALLELSKKREEYPDLAPMLWYSFGTVPALLQEIVSIYSALHPPTLSPAASNRVCNALALLQCVASHTDTRSLFLKGASRVLSLRGEMAEGRLPLDASAPPPPLLPSFAAHIPLYLYPFLSTASRTKPFEYLRLTSLGVIGALVKVDDSEVVNFLLQTEIIPLCLRIMESGSELSKTVATFIVQKILLDDVGLNYICATADRFFAVSTVLSNMVAMLVEAPSQRLLKHIIRCYLRLADNAKAKEALRQVLPASLQGQTFAETLKADAGATRWLGQLLRLVFPEEGQ